jgi:hypothetical protein
MAFIHCLLYYSSDRAIVLWIYSVSQEEMSIFWEVIVSVILSKKVYVYMCPIPNGFWDRDISLYSSKIVDKEILHTVGGLLDQFCTNCTRYSTEDAVRIGNLFIYNRSQLSTTRLRIYTIIILARS